MEDNKITKQLKEDIIKNDLIVKSLIKVYIYYYYFLFLFIFIAILFKINNNLIDSKYGNAIQHMKISISSTSKWRNKCTNIKESLM